MAWYSFYATQQLEYIFNNVSNVSKTMSNSAEVTAKAAETIQATTYGVGNATTLFNNLNSGCKAASVGYGVALTGASLIDACQAKNTLARCLFGAGSICGAAGTVSSSLTVLNITVGMSAFGLASGAVGGAFFFLGRKINKVARNVDIPAL